MKMFYSTSASRVFLPSKHITGHFSMNSFIFQIVILWSSALFSHKQNGVSSLLLSMFFQGPRRFADLLRFLGLQQFFSRQCSFLSLWGIYNMRVSYTSLLPQVPGCLTATFPLLIFAFTPLTPLFLPRESLFPLSPRQDQIQMGRGRNSIGLCFWISATFTF